MRYTFILETLSPLSHGDTVTGIDNATNTRLFMRQDMVVNGTHLRVPCLSENALRAVLFRHPLHRHLLQTLSIQHGELPQSVVNLLFSGGSMLKGASVPSGVLALGHAVRQRYPSLALLGGSVDRFILPRSDLRVCCWLVASEYVPALQHIAPELAEEAQQLSAFDLLGEETRTRGTGEESEGNQMLYTYEVLATGARALVEVTLSAGASPLVESAVAAALDQYLVHDAYFGGQGRQGRGRLACAALALPSAQPYYKYIAEYADALTQGLTTGELGSGVVLCDRR